MKATNLDFLLFFFSCYAFFWPIEFGLWINSILSVIQ